MAKVLVTGGAGFIGSHLCDALVARGDDVVVFDDFSLGRDENLGAVRSRIKVLRASILDIQKHASELEGVSLVYHLAALISSHDSLTEPDEYLRVNLGGLLRLLDVVRTLKPRPRIVFASSSTVYGIRSEAVCREVDLPAPATVYALSKLAGEQLLAMYRERDGYEHCSLRLFNVYGPRQNPMHPYANVTCKFSHAAATGGGIKLYGTGENSRDFVYIDDVVRALLRAGSRTPRAVYNVGTGQDTSIVSLLATIERLGGVRLKAERCPPWSNDIKAIRAEVGALADDLGVRAQVGLDEGLKRTIEFFRQSAR